MEALELNLRVKICLSRCSSRVKDWPQYVQKGMVGEGVAWRKTQNIKTGNMGY